MARDTELTQVSESGDSTANITHEADGAAAISTSRSRADDGSRALAGLIQLVCQTKKEFTWSFLEVMHGSSLDKNKCITIARRFGYLLPLPPVAKEIFEAKQEGNLSTEQLEETWNSMCSEEKAEYGSLARDVLLSITETGWGEQDDAHLQKFIREAKPSTTWADLQGAFLHGKTWKYVVYRAREAGLYLHGAPRDIDGFWLFLRETREAYSQIYTGEIDKGRMATFIRQDARWKAMSSQEKANFQAKAIEWVLHQPLRALTKEEYFEKFQSFFRTQAEFITECIEANLDYTVPLACLSERFLPHDFKFKMASICSAKKSREGSCGHPATAQSSKVQTSTIATPCAGETANPQS